MSTRDGGSASRTLRLDKDAGLTSDVFEGELADFFAEGLDDPLVREDASAAGIDVESLRESPPEVSVEPAKGEFTGVAEAVILHIAYRAADKLIDEVIVPWIKRRRGQGAVRDAGTGDVA